MASVKTRRIGEYLWEIPMEGQMRVPGRVYADGDSMDLLRREGSSGGWDALAQVRNVACLPGIRGASLAMADIHPGYGFPIGGVGAFDMEEGVVTIAGVGFDINCGVRTMRVDIPKLEIEKRKNMIADELFNRVPAGVGSTGSMKLTAGDMDRMLVEGARFSLELGYGVEGDLEFIEDNGMVEGADPGCVSDRAKLRQLRQVGTLGSGNHYLEVQYVDKVYDGETANVFGLREDSILVSIHTGSRALGHQIGTDYQKVLREASRKHRIRLPDEDLAAAPIQSDEGRRYISAVRAGINCGFANRQAISGLVRQAFEKVLSLGGREISTLYEIGHNNLKVEEHRLGGERQSLLVHRKGATRAFATGRSEVPQAYKACGHPVLVGGTMGTASYILTGTERGMEETFGSSIHGAGRLKSRKKALRDYRGDDIVKELFSRGIDIRAHGKKGVAEEAPGAYKDVEDVVSTMEGAGVSRRVARLRPIICVKG